jgi:dTDP-glucose 4,6-dehydratase
MEKEKKKKVCITGGAGFLGSHVCEHFLKNTDWDIVVLDKLTYASNGFDRLRDMDCFDNKRISIYTIDLQKSLSFGIKQEIGDVDYILNIASESHVDNSISDPVNFILNNVSLVLNMLEWTRELLGKNNVLKRFIQFSTDETYGTAPEGVNYKEGDRHNAGNPYSASKDAQEAICRAYSNTYGLPINIVNSMNIIGERQHPEKFIPLCIKKILNDEIIQVHSNENLTKSGTRFYLHARNIAKALQFILEKTDEKLNKIDTSLGCWNVVGDKEIENSELAKIIGSIIGKDIKMEMINFHSSRPGHDLRYALSGEKLKKAGFNYPKSFMDTLKKTVEWYLKTENKKWLNI